MAKQLKSLNSFLKQGIQLIGMLYVIGRIALTSLMPYYPSRLQESRKIWIVGKNIALCTE